MCFPPIFETEISFSFLRSKTCINLVIGYTLYSVQQVLDIYRGLEPADRDRVDSALSDTGWGALLSYEPRHRLTKDGFNLVFAAE